MIDYYEPQIDLTLLGCGFLGAYHIGAIYILEQIWPHKPYNKICGASCGGLLAALLICGIKIDIVLYHAIDIIRRIRKALRRPLQLIAMRQLIEENLDELLPENAHLLCSNRLGLSLTKLSWKLENKFVWIFDSRQELIDAIVAGCFIPIWSGSPVNFPKFRGKYFIDGAYSDNLPKFKLTKEDLLIGTRQVRVCPFNCSSEESVEVSPKDPDSWMNIGTMKVMGTKYIINWSNIVRSVYAMSLIYCSNYKPYLLAGFDDMKEYLFRSELIKCEPCYRKEKDWLDDSRRTRGPACISCLRLLERVDSLKVDEEFSKLMEL